MRMSTKWQSKYHRALARAIRWANPQPGIDDIVNRIPIADIRHVKQRDLEALGIKFAPPPIVVCPR